MKKIFKTLLIIIAVSFVSIEAKAQSSLELDLMSRYVWRGADFGNSPSIQPGASYSAGGLEVGAWAAIATTGNPAGSEIDWYVSYTLAAGQGDLSFVLTDYTFPEDPAGNYFQAESHYLEMGIGYDGPESFPITLSGGIFLTNDEDYSIYGEAGYSISAFDVFLGMTPSKSAMYGTRKAGIINSGISTSRNIAVTETLSITLTSSAIMNFYDNNAFFLFGISL